MDGAASQTSRAMATMSTDQCEATPERSIVVAGYYGRYVYMKYICR